MSEVDLQRLRESVQYGTDYCKVLTGEDKRPLMDYPDTSDQSILQYVFDTLDEEKLYNEVLHEEMQNILDMWLVEDLTAHQAKTQLITLLADYYDFGC